MKHNDMTKAVALWCIIVLGTFLPGCDETGVGIDSPAVGTLIFKTYVTDPLSFKVYINDDLIDSNKQFEYYDGTIRLKIVEATSRRVIFDDDYGIHPFGGTQVAVTVLQSRSGSVPVCLVPPEEESAPPAGYGKIAILYDFADFPDSLKAVVENTTTVTSNVYTPTDSLILKKNEISRFFLSRSGMNKARLKLYSASGDRKQVANIVAARFYNMGSGFSMYTTSDKGHSGGIEDVTIERIY